jgi:long-subunit fatty acid transport protein
MRKSNMTKHTQILTSLLVPMLLSGAALANPLANSAPFTDQSETGNAQSYFGVSAVRTETALRLPGWDDTFEEDGNMAGLQLNAGYNLAAGFSVDGFFRYLEDSGDVKSNDFGGVFTYKRQLVNGFAGFLGAGYQWRELEGEEEGDTVTLKNNAVIANVGVEYQVEKFVARLSYTHGFTNSSDAKAEVDFLGVPLTGKVDLDKKDLGTLGLSGSYAYDENTAITAGYSVELLEEAAITDDSTFTLGLLYKF